MPAVSVIIPAYNAAATLERALASVAKQTLSGIEILVVDDGSTDATPEILARMAAADRRLKILTQANGGVARARNAAIGAATGEWVATIDADDLWHPRKLELQLAAARAGGAGCGMVYSWSRRIDMADRVIADMGAPRHADQVLHQLIASNFMRNASSAMVLRRAALAVGGFDPGLQEAGAQGAEDLKFYLAVARGWRVALAPHFLTGYRQIDGSMSQMPARMRRSIEMVLQDSERQDPGVPAAVFALARTNYDLYAAALALAGGDRAGFFSYAGAALARRPLDATVLLGVNALWRLSAMLDRSARPLFAEVDMDARMPMPLSDWFSDFQAAAACRAARLPLPRRQRVCEAEG